MGFILENLVCIESEPGLVFGAVIKHTSLDYRLVDQALVRSMEEVALAFGESLGSDAPFLWVIKVSVTKVGIAFPRGSGVMKKFHVLLTT